MNRKDFLIKSSLAAFAITSIACVTKEEGKFVGDCDTTNDILGPFYRPNAPTRYDLTTKDMKGTIIELKGKSVWCRLCNTAQRCLS